MSVREEIERIIQEGVEKNLSTDEIVDRILRAGTQSRKKEGMPFKEFEELVRESKRNIQEARRLLVKSLTGNAQS